MDVKSIIFESHTFPKVPTFTFTFTLFLNSENSGDFDK